MRNGLGLLALSLLLLYRVDADPTLNVQSVSDGVEALQNRYNEMRSSRVNLEQVLSGLESEIAALERELHSFQTESPEFSPDQIEFFEKRIRPVLIANCFECHSDQKQKGGLRLDSRSAVLRGGDSGHAVDLSHPEGSRLLEAIAYDNLDLQMPPRSKLADHEIADLAAWVKMRAPWPEESGQAQTAKSDEPFSQELKRRAQRWSFQPLRPVQVPEVKEKDWIRNPIDAFILSHHEQESIPHAAEASPRT
ncbi:MAG: hypothetical protein KC978_23920, partial [Candidatus Omnitrophica bacterium]|nr:hypothetical protein [Candidatus Omnitrophota bacterium]